MASRPSQFKRIVLNSRPAGDIEPDTFRTEVVPFDEKLTPKQGEALVKCLWLSLDPAMRGYIRDTRSYLPPVQIGETMRAQGLGIVEEAGPESKFQRGDLVSGSWGMTEYAVMKDKTLEKLVVPPGAILLDFLNTLGLSGLTAYFGLKEVGKIKKGETLVVSGAAGSVGSLTCQLGKAIGAKVYAIAGSEEKCTWLKNEIGVDGVLNYKSPTFREEVKKIGYLDVYFDNVGGDILDLMLTRLKKDARIVMCGAISEYNSGKPKGLQNYMNIISQRATVQGFIVFDYAERYKEALAELAQGIHSGAIKRKFEIVQGGIEEAPKALPMLFTGGNTGKLVIQVAEEGEMKGRL
ncbi:hypothetical protein AMATHDRAFT_73796 [Amanita thiersii Skay4041]|uniref:Enoyl reductase (ER) domain-containing protein n=1 Tax=Amanita thiersii Skay4041 TaxID=703135 RepID=A0A2A9NS98_9AGAR|nr:hypothetical protein AMATHDRAFT_73796 [Amanita thiersii Skay4041]